MTSARYADHLPRARSPFRSPPAAFTRTAGDGRPVTPEGRVRALVHQIAADPALVAWLRDYGAKLLERAGDRLAASTLDDVEACEAVRSLAGAHRRGETALW